MLLRKVKKMSKASKVVNAAAQGITTTSHHPYWNDVNPIKRQTLTADDHKARREREREQDERWQRRNKLLSVLYPNRKILKG